jgi:hypothetical protein
MRGSQGRSSRMQQRAGAGQPRCEGPTAWRPCRQPSPGHGLLVVALLLASVGTASAEYAWVLWGQPYPPMKEFMFVAVDAFTTREDCLWEKDRRAQTIKADLKEGRIPDIVVSVCLPDTVDPRGPKEK